MILSIGTCRPYALKRGTILITTRTSTTSSLRGFPFYGLPRLVRAEPKKADIPETVRDRLQLTVQNAVTAFRNPDRADAVAAVGELTGHIALNKLYHVMQSDASGRRILQERPIVSKHTIPYQELIESAEGISFDQISEMEKDVLRIKGRVHALTFGQAYGSFLRSHGFDPDERDAVRYIDEPDLAYVMLRYRQCHDFYHTLTGLPPTVLGEIGLKWFELFQTGLPLAALSSTIGSFRLSTVSEQDTLWNVYLPWALKLSKSVPYGTLLNVHYEKEFNTSLKDLRQRLRIQAAPTQGRLHF